MSTKLTDDQRKRVAAYATILDELTPAKQDRRDVFHHYLNRFALQLLTNPAATKEPSTINKCPASYRDWQNAARCSLVEGHDGAHKDVAQNFYWLAGKQGAVATEQPPSNHPLCDAEVAKPGFGTSIKAQLVPLAFAHVLEDRLQHTVLEFKAAMEKVDELQKQIKESEADAAAVRRQLNGPGEAYRQLLGMHKDPGHFQEAVGAWMHGCFDYMTATSKAERNHRFLEEALELVQSLGCTMSETTRLVEYVYGRPAGEPRQEVGGVLVTLAALCFTNKIKMHEAVEAELARIKQPEVIEKIRAKQAAKPKLSPLPSQPQATDPYADLRAAVRAGKKIEWCPPPLMSSRWLACDVTLKQIDGPGPVFAFDRKCYRIVEPTDQYADLLAAIRDGKTIEWASNPSTGPWLKCPVNKSDLGKAVNEVFVDKRIHYRIVEPAAAAPYAGPPAAVVAEREAVASLTEDARQYRLRQLRYRAAVADGWRFTECPHAPKCWYVTENKTGVVLKRTFDTEWDACWQTTPDYPQDASAVAAAVARLPQQKQELFAWLLRDKMFMKNPKSDIELAFNRMVLAAATAPAAVLCEAYVEAAEEGLTPGAK